MTRPALPASHLRLKRAYEPASLGFGHDPTRWPEFQRRYRAELRQHTQELEQIRALAKKQTVTLVYSARDEAHNDAIVSREVLEETRGPRDG